MSFRASGLRGFRGFGGFRVSGFRGFGIFGVSGFQVSAFRRCGVSCRRKRKMQVLHFLHVTGLLGVWVFFPALDELLD